MIQTRLEDHLTNFYNRQELRSQKLTELRSLAEGWRTTREKPAMGAAPLWSWPRMLSAGRVAPVVFLLLLGAFYLGRNWRPMLPGEMSGGILAQSVSREIAMNHRKQLNLEFSARDYAALQAQMGKLDFALAPPSNPAASSLHVVGARYCSIQGQLAAQIRVRDSAGTVYTLYETRLTDKLRAVSGEVKTEGVGIRLWSEEGLFYGLAVNHSRPN